MAKIVSKFAFKPKKIIMIGALIGAGLSVASSIAGNIAANKRNAEARAMMREQLRENQKWRDREYYSDPTKRGDTIRLLTQTGKMIRERNQAARGTQAVMGGTEDSVKAVRESNSQAISDITGNLVASNEARKDNIDAQYRQERSRIRGQQIADQMNQANTIANTVKSVAGVGAQIANAVDSTSAKAAAAGDTSTGAGGVSAPAAAPAQTSHFRNLAEKMSALRDSLGSSARDYINQWDKMQKTNV